MSFFSDMLGGPKAPQRLPDPGFQDDKETIEEQVNREDTMASNMRRSANDAQRQIAEMESMQRKQVQEKPIVIYRKPKRKIIYRESPPAIEYRDIPAQKPVKQNGYAWDSGMYTGKPRSSARIHGGPAWDSGMYTGKNKSNISFSASEFLFGLRKKSKKR